MSNRVSIPIKYTNGEVKVENITLSRGDKAEFRFSGDKALAYVFFLDKEKRPGWPWSKSFAPFGHDRIIVDDGGMQDVSGNRVQELQPSHYRKGGKTECRMIVHVIAKPGKTQQMIRPSQDLPNEYFAEVPPKIIIDDDTPPLGGGTREDETRVGSS